MSVVADGSASQSTLPVLRSPIKGIAVEYLHAFDRTFVNTNRVHSFGGDLLVQRARSLSGRKSKFRQSASDLHLRRIGEGCIIDANDACALGKIKKMQHLLRVIPLPSYVPPGKFRLAYWSTGMIFVHESYQNSKAVGESCVVGAAEYLKIESTFDKASITWSSELGIGDALSRIHAIAGDPVAEASGYVSLREYGESSAGEGRVEDIVQYVEHYGENVLFAFVPHENFDVVWGGRQARLVSSDVPYTQIGIISKRGIGAEVLNRILMDTASPAVSSDSMKVIGSMENSASPRPDLESSDYL